MRDPRVDVPLGDDPLALNSLHAFDIRINFDKRWSGGDMPFGGSLNYTSIGENSTVSGPLLNGKVVDYSGADWPVRRADGVVELNAHYMIQADDGALIYIRNLGYVHSPLDDGATPSYFRCTPYFRAPAGPHEWLNRKVLVGVGQRRAKVAADDPPDHSLFRYYVIV